MVRRRTRGRVEGSHLACCRGNAAHLRARHSGLHTEVVDFAIRDYRASDFDRLWNIDQICFPPGIAYTQMDLTGFITRRKAITLVAELAGRTKEEVENGGSPCIVGFAIAQPIRKIGRILTLDVVPQARRHGLGRRLMEDCELRLRALHCEQVFLETAVDNEPALQMYHKLGYLVLRTLPAYYQPQALDAYLMGKAL